MRISFHESQHQSLEALGSLTHLYVDVVKCQLNTNRSFSLQFIGYSSQNKGQNNIDSPWNADSDVF